MINIVSFFTSMYAGFAVFSIIGYMASEYGLDVEQVIDSGKEIINAFNHCPQYKGDTVV